MGSISNCPNCGDHVSIPEGVDRQAMVRCPLCEAEFPLDRAMTTAAVPPPELVPVAHLSAGSTNGPTVAGNIPNGLTLAERASDGLSPAEETSNGLSLADETSGGPGPVEDPAGSEEIYAVAGAAVEEEEPESEKYVFGGQPAGGAEGFGVPGAAAAWRSQQAEPSALGQIGKLLGIVLGGLLGIAVAYLALSLVSPANFDYLHLWGRPRSSAPNGKTPGGPPATPPGPGETDRWPGLE